MSVRVRQAVARDAAACCEVLRRSIRELCAADYAEVPGFVDTWLENKTPEQVKRWIESPYTYCAVSLREDATVGFGAISNQAEVLLCYVVPEVKGAGVGYQLLSHLEAWGRDEGHRRFSTVSTVTARAFYERQGYRLAGEPVYVGETVVEYPMVKAFR